MNLREYVETKIKPNDELLRFLNKSSWGQLVARFDVTELKAPDSKARNLREAISDYANDASDANGANDANDDKGLFGEQRLRFYHQVDHLFKQLLEDCLVTSGYELSTSFLENDEAYLILLRASHEGMSLEQLANDVLHCSANAVGERRRALCNGVRIGDMCIKADFGYGGAFESSVHPVSLPLNLSEVYVLLNALKEYENANRESPHGALASRMANMVYGELSDYAKKRLDDRFKEAGYSFEAENPVYLRDIYDDRSLRVYFEKVCARVQVSLADGKTLVGRVLSKRSKKVPRDFDDPRPSLFLELDDGRVERIPWSQVVDIAEVKGER